jgi:hypothetical protein
MDNTDCQGAKMLKVLRLRNILSIINMSLLFWLINVAEFINNELFDTSE